MPSNRFTSLKKGDSVSLGRAIDVLAIDTRSPNAKKKAIPYLADQTAIPYAVINNCRNGKPNEPSGRLTPAYFRQLIEYFWGIPGGLQSVDDVLALAEAAGEDYVIELRKEWFKNLAIPKDELSGIGHNPQYPRPAFQISRSDVIQEIERLADQSMILSSPIVVLGAPGSGKSEMMRQLAGLKSNHRLRQRFPDVTLMVSQVGNDLQVVLLSLLLQMGKDVSPLASSEDILRVLYRGAISQRRSLILLDDVTDPSIVQQILQAGIHPSCLIVITTSSPYVARVLATSRTLILEMPSFSPKQAVSYYRNLWGRDVSTQEQSRISEICRVLNGNPLALYFAYHLAARLGEPPDWDETLGLLKASDSILPDELVKEVFLPQEKIYHEIMTAQQQERLRAIGGLPYFHEYHLDVLQAIWGVSASQALLALTGLKEMGFVTELEHGESWRMHRHTHAIARYFLRQIPEEHSSLHAWERRAFQAQTVLNAEQELQHDVAALNLCQRFSLWWQYFRQEETPFHALIQTIGFAWQMITQPTYNRHWQALVQDTSVVTDVEYLAAFRLIQRTERRRHTDRWMVLAWLLITFLTVVSNLLWGGISSVAWKNLAMTLNLTWGISGIILITRIVVLLVVGEWPRTLWWALLSNRIAKRSAE
jgi:hypothetical protein